MEKIRIIAHALFDGWVSARCNSVYELGYCNKNETLIDQFGQDVTNTYGRLTCNLRRRRNGAWEITYRSKNILHDLKRIMPDYSTRNMNIRLPPNIMNATGTYSIILRAFWDDEGNVNHYREHRTRKLRAPCKPPILRQQLMRMHHALGIRSREEDNHSITIGGTKNFRRFQEKIGFTPGVRVGLAKFGKCVWVGYEKAAVLSRMVG